MMERLNLMITGELCDPLNKQLKIDPVQLDFGVVCQGKNYQMYFKLRNDDNMTNRVMVRKSNSDSNFISIENFVGGKVVYGETKKDHEKKNNVTENFDEIEKGNISAYNVF